MFDFPSLFGPMRIVVFPTVIFLAAVILRYFWTVNDLSFIFYWLLIGGRTVAKIPRPDGIVSPRRTLKTSLLIEKVRI